MIIQNKTQKTFVQKILAFLLALCITSGITGPIMSDGITSLAAAPASYTTITANSTSSVRISSSGSAQYFKFVPTQSGTYKFYSSNNSSSDPKGDLLDANGNTLASNDDGASNNNFSITYACTGGTTYYVKAYMYGSNTGSYTLNVTTISIDCEHNYVLQSTTAADCENDGIATYVCSFCDETYRSTVASALGHTFENGTCTRCGSTDLANATCINITTANGTNYPLFNSGRTESDGYSFGTTMGGANNNINIHSYDNGGYDIFEQMPNVQIPATIEYVGCSFLLNVNVNELAKVSIYAYDTDETDGESDTLYLVDETSNVRYALGNLSGMNNSWNNTEFNISPDYLINGHQYHFSIVIDSAEGDNSHVSQTFGRLIL